MSKAAHFLDIPAEAATSDDSSYALLPIPWENSTSFGKGTARGPSAIIRASKQIDTVDEELLLPINMAVQTLKPLNFARLSSPSAMKLIYRKAAEIHRNKRFLLAVGGEHSISAPLIKAAAENYPNLSVLQFDAHLDLRNTYTGSKFSHASVMRRVTDMHIPVVHAGIRSLCAEELDIIKSTKPAVFFAKDMKNAAAGRLARNICQALTEDVYITFDVDAFDPSIMPGTGTPEPGGVDWYTAIEILREVIARKNVVSADVVELAPVKGSSVSEYTAARLAQKIITYHHYRSQLLARNK